MAISWEAKCPSCEGNPVCRRDKPQLGTALSAIGLGLTLVALLFLGFLVYDGLVLKTGRTTQFLVLAMIPGIPGAGVWFYNEAKNPLKCPVCGKNPLKRDKGPA